MLFGISATSIEEFRSRVPIRYGLFYLVAFCVLVISIAFFSFNVTRPYIDTRLVQDDDVWRVGQVFTGGLADKAGIKEGDIPIEINGQPAATFLEKYNDAGMVFGMLIKELTVQTDEGEVKSVSVKGSSVSQESVLEESAQFVLCLSFWIVGFYVLWKKPRDGSAILLCMCGLSLGLALTSLMAAERAVPGAIHLEVAASVITPWLLAHFFLTLTSERDRFRSRFWVILIYSPVLITAMLFPLIGYSDGQSVLWFRSFRLFLYIIGFLVAVGVLFYNFLRAPSIRARQQIKIVLVSTLAAIIPFVTFSLLPEVIWGRTILAPELGVMFAALIPLGMGYAVITRQLLGIDLIIRRCMIYGLTLLALGVVFSLLFALVLIYWKSLGDPGKMIVALSVIVTAAVLFWPFKNHVEAFLDRFVYKGRFHYLATIDRLRTMLTPMSSFVEISRRTVDMVTESLNLSGGFVLTESGSGQIQVIGAQGAFLEPRKQWQVVKSFSKQERKSEFPDLASDVDPDIAYLVPLQGKEKQDIGMLCFSPKESGNNYSISDLYLLQDAAKVAADSMQKAAQTEVVGFPSTDLELTLKKLKAVVECAGTIKFEKEGIPELELSKTLLRLLESRDTYARGHADRVADLAKRTAIELELSQSDTETIELAAFLHDIGKVAVPGKLLINNESLTCEEETQIQLHVDYGVDILSNSNYFVSIVPLVEAHHEQYDGKGYPRGQSSENIPLGARIIAVADAFDVMTSITPQGTTLSYAEACESLITNTGTLFCPKVVEGFLRV